MDERFHALVNDGVAFEALIGSHAYGMATPESDEDVRAVTILADRTYYTGLKNFEQYNDPTQEDRVVYDVRKFVKLALKANPNIFDVLWSPIVRYKNPWGERLIAMRDGFISKACCRTYSGYALDQMRKLSNAIQAEKPIKWKHAAHLIRLLRMGCEIVEYGEVNVNRTEIDAGELLDIRQGHWSFARVKETADELDARLRIATKRNLLPLNPDFAAAEQFLVDVVSDVLR